MAIHIENKVERHQRQAEVVRIINAFWGGSPNRARAAGWLKETMLVFYTMVFTLFLAVLLPSFEIKS